MALVNLVRPAAADPSAASPERTVLRNAIQTRERTQADHAPRRTRCVD
jgi:hypothetical protein